MPDVNIFGPGHYPTTGETASRPMPTATLKAFRAWFAQCDAQGQGGTKVDEMFLNFLLASFRDIVDSAVATQGELVESMLSESIARYASGGIFCVDAGSASTYVLATPTSFVLPKTYFKGMMIAFAPVNANSANSGASTVAVYSTIGGSPTSLGTRKLLTSAGAELPLDALAPDVQVVAWYDPAANSGAGAFKLFPPYDPYVQVAPYFRMDSPVTTIPNNAPTVLTNYGNAESVLQDSVLSAVAGTLTIGAREAGVWNLVGCGDFDASGILASTQEIFYIRKNTIPILLCGVQTPSGTASRATAGGTIVRLAAGDVVDAAYTQNSGASGGIVASPHVHFAGARIRG